MVQKRTVELKTNFLFSFVFSSLPLFPIFFLNTSPQKLSMIQNITDWVQHINRWLNIKSSKMSNCNPSTDQDQQVYPRKWDCPRIWKGNTTTHPANWSSPHNSFLVWLYTVPNLMKLERKPGDSIIWTKR